MFDIGFTELVVIAVIALLVIGPERLPGAVRTGSLWLRRIRRGFNDLRQEVEQELHNDAVLQELKKTRDEFGEEARQLQQGLEETPPPEPEHARQQDQQNDAGNSTGR